MVVLSGRITTRDSKVQGWTFHVAIRETAADREKTAGKPGPIEDNRSPARLTPRSEFDGIPQMLENKGVPSIGPTQFECAKPFDDLLRRSNSPVTQSRFE
jgi:hypothetical protein